MSLICRTRVLSLRSRTAWYGPATTVSPALRPSSTSKCSSPAIPTLTGLKFATPFFTTNTPSPSFFFRSAAVRLGAGSPPCLPPPPRLGLVGQVLVLPHRERDDRDRECLLPGVRDHPRRGGEVGPDAGGRAVEGDLHVEVHGAVGGGSARGAGLGELRAVADLGDPPDERGVG